MAFGVIVPYGLNQRTRGYDYRVIGVRATEAAARKLARPAGSLLVEFYDKPRPRAILADRGYYGTSGVKQLLDNPPGAKTRAKRPAAKKAKRPAKRAAKRPARNPRYEPPPLSDWETILYALNQGGRVRDTETRAAVQAVRRLKAECAGGSAEKNPRGAVMSRRVLKLYYVHAGDGREYVHTFDPGVSMTAEGDRVIVLKRPDGKALSQNF